MRVLWLARDYPYPADTGFSLYTQGLVRALATAGVEVTALANARSNPTSMMPSSSVTDNVHWTRVKRRKLHPALSLLTSLPKDAFTAASREFRSELQRHLDADSWDAVVIDHIATSWALDPLLRWQKANGRRLLLIYVSHNHETTLRPAAARGYHQNPLLKLILRLEALKYVRLEKKLVQRSDIVTAITEQDKALYIQMAPDKTIIALPPGYSGARNWNWELDARVPRRVVIAGSFDWAIKQQNLIDFIRVADPIFTRAHITLHVVGRASSQFINGIQTWASSCNFTGPVTDIAPYLMGARLGVMADQIGGGFKLKLLDYVFAGLPVAAIGNQVAGLPLIAGEDMLVADDVTQLCHRIVAAIDDFALLNQMRRSALLKCATVFDWSTRGHDLRLAVEEGASRREQCRIDRGANRRQGGPVVQEKNRYRYLHRTE